MDFTAVYMKVSEGYIAFLEELAGANTQGASLDEARENLKEAVAMVLEANRVLARGHRRVGSHTRAVASLIRRAGFTNAIARPATLRFLHSLVSYRFSTATSQGFLTAMKRTDLIRHLERSGCQQLREQVDSQIIAGSQAYRG